MQIFLTPLFQVGPSPVVPGFLFPLPLTSAHPPGRYFSTAPDLPRRVGGQAHPPPRGGNRGGRSAAPEFYGGLIARGVEQNVQVPQGGGRGIRIGPQGLPLHHRRALRLCLGLMGAPPRHLQGTPSASFPFCSDRSDPQ